jgi:hypothetical protein
MCFRIIQRQPIVRFSVICLLALLVFNGLSGQSVRKEVSIELGPVFKVDERSIPINIIGSDDSAYYILYGGGKYGIKNQVIRKFNRDLIPTDEVLNLFSEEQDEAIQDVDNLQIGNNLWKIMAHPFPHITKYYLQKINLDPLGIEFSKTIADIKSDLRTTSPNVSESSLFARIKSSLDTSRIVLFHPFPVKDKGKQKIRIIMFDNEFNQLRSDDYEFPYSKENFYVHEIYLKNTGELIINGIVFPDSDERTKEEKDQYEFLIFSLFEGSIKEITRIRNYGRNIHQARLKFIRNDELVLAGLYSNRNMYAIRGTFYYRFNENKKEISANNFQKFDDSFYTSLLTESKKKRLLKKIEKGDYEDPHYVLTNCLCDSTGELLLIAEQRYISSSTMSYAYYYQNIAIIKLDRNGKIIWSTKIGKDNSEYKMIMSPAVYAGFIPIKSADELFLFYNGNVENLHHSAGPVSRAFGATVVEEQALMGTTVSNNGNYRRRILANTKKLNGFRIRPGLSRWLDENTLILFAQDPNNVKNQRFIKINFD